MHAPDRLDQLQRWMLSAIASEASDEASSRLLPSRHQSVEQRLAVYQSAYIARLVECLRELFPVFTAAVGHEEFAAFAVGYVRRYPPASYTLNRLADRFVDYLTETRPAVPSPGWPDFLLELARLEHTLDDVFDGPGQEDWPPLDLSSQRDLSPDALLALRFIAAPDVRLLSFRFPINDFYTAAKRGESLPWPAPQATFLAITRRDYIVRRIPLEKGEFQVLQGLLAGRTLADALALATEPLSPGDVQRWFADWGRLRLFATCGE
jgi:hypothetical protein